MKARRQQKTEHLLDRMADEGIDTTHLIRVGTRPPLDEYLSQLWQRRHFMWADSRSRVATQYSNSRLGRLWFLLQPVLDSAFYWLVFGIILGVTRGVDNFVAYVVIGILMFRSSQRALVTGVTAISGASAMIRAFSFPRAAVPLSLVMREALESVPRLFMVLVIIMATPPHELPGTAWLFLPLVWAIQICLNIGLSLIAARIGHVFPDARYAMSFVSRLLLYSSGVIFPISAFVNNRALSLVVELNPIYQILHMYRTVLMENSLPTLWSCLVVSSWSVFLVLAGLVFFWKGESTYGR